MSPQEKEVAKEIPSNQKETRRRLLAISQTQTFTNSLKTDLERSLFTSHGQIVDEIINPNFPYNCNFSISHIQITPNNSTGPLDQDKEKGDCWSYPKKMFQTKFGGTHWVFKPNVYLIFLA